MKNSVIRLIFVLALISTVGIIVSQIFWVRNAYELQDKDFENKVNISLKNVVTKIWELKRSKMVLYDAVQEVKPGFYIAQINHQITPELLEHFLREQFVIQGLITDFEYGQYDCNADSVMFFTYVSMSGKKGNEASVTDFPRLSRENYYFAVHFPNRKQYIAEQIELWIYSSVFLFVVLIILGLTVSIIMKQKRLREVQKDFVNNMTHEFKTPLATIQLSAEVLKKPTIINNPQRLLNYATIIDKEASLLALQVERVLQMAHAEKGEIILRKEKVFIQDLIQEVASNFENLLEKHSVRLDLVLLDKPIECFIDTLHVKNALGNLVENAIKYSGQNAVLTIRLRGNDKRIKIEVIDNGPGIAPEHQKMLFSRFYRVPTGNRHDVKGFGLGLNYVRIICKAHGGDATCTSKPNEGSTFSMILPTDVKSK